MTQAILIGIPGPTELIIIAGVLVILFGANRVPALMRGIGEGIRDLRQAVKGITDEAEEARRELDR